VIAQAACNSGYYNEGLDVFEEQDIYETSTYYATYAYCPSSWIVTGCSLLSSAGSSHYTDVWAPDEGHWSDVLPDGSDYCFVSDSDDGSNSPQIVESQAMCLDN